MTESTLAEVIEEATQLLVKFSIPLYRKDRVGRPLQYGTGFFVRTQSATFLVSAAHILDYAKSHALFYYSEPGQLRNLSGQLIRSTGEEDRAKDLIDVAVLRLSGGSIPLTLRSRSMRWTCPICDHVIAHAPVRATSSSDSPPQRVRWTQLVER